MQEQDLFDLEYWSLEQAKLGKAKPPAMQGQIIIITGGAGAIGSAIATEFHAAGAEIMLIDKNAEQLEQIRSQIDPKISILQADVTQRDAPTRIIEAVTKTFGGVDILISNAGSAKQSSIIDMDQQLLRDSFDLNFFAHFSLAQEVFKTFRKQAINGQILFNVSKQAVNPGQNFGAYGLPKSALFSLCVKWRLNAAVMVFGLMVSMQIASGPAC